MWPSGRSAQGGSRCGGRQPVSSVPRDLAGCLSRSARRAKPILRRLAAAPPPGAAGSVTVGDKGFTVAANSTSFVRVAPSTGWVSLRLRDLWQYRELLFFLTWRDIKVRYKQTALGIAWAIIQPLFAMIIFSLFFGRLAKMPSDGVPYPLWSYVGLVPWTFFATGLTQSSNSLVEGANLLRKIYFPRLAVPIAAVMAVVVDLGVSFLLLVGMILFYGVSLTPAIFTLPLFVMLGFVTALGAGLWLAAFNVKYRDIRYVVPFLIQLWMFASPVTYPSSLLPEQWRMLYALNPMVGVVEGFRWALLGTGTAPGVMAGVSSLAALMLLISGAYHFRRMEKTFADIV